MARINKAKLLHALKADLSAAEDLKNAVDAVDTTVDLPMQLLEPLLHYIGYRAYGSINSNIQAENSTHYTRFIKACDDIEKSGVLTAENTKNEFLKTKGFI